MLTWVVEAALACPQLNGVVVAADSDEVATLCYDRGWVVEFTSPALPSGSDRVHAVSLLHPADIYVNIQADEPLLQHEHLTALLRPFALPGVDVTTLKVLCSPGNVHNHNAVKVVTAADGRALYFSRAAIPFDRDGSGNIVYWKHLGLYAFRRAALNRFTALPPSPLELSERLEQLRLLENGLSLFVEPTAFDTIGVDTEADLQLVEAALMAREITGF